MKKTIAPSGGSVSLTFGGGHGERSLNKKRGILQTLAEICRHLDKGQVEVRLKHLASTRTGHRSVRIKGTGKEAVRPRLVIKYGGQVAIFAIDVSLEELKSAVKKAGY